ncbi:hypothetical protein P3X46_007057 [Hevea brasiliensis]|uniref:Disease resistance RPP13-like protein 4 n=1 Tax=Hevea brasiliensis TaxID=3981 RepID=A0ABQ9MS84_HEVBR|nr:disease resistance RPP13-like protein 4 [Hevea brasiliensis]XP_021637460.2 disease resistance RPP13-like protein 4 [Hevea brasiliensis]KAJ9183153.1 hypothetical protein P3X46_007057 [Hevea brasiliensis]KAJ9183154.1 hypothetical protein P3X46_007057 [Hevea brasiliensis]
MASVDALISPLVDRVLTILTSQAQYVLGFSYQFEAMQAMVRRIRALLGDSDNSNEEIVETTAKFRDLMYEADDILTDCLIREEYHDNNIVFRYKTGRKMNSIYKRMKEMDDILGGHLKEPSGGSSSHGDDTEQFTRTTTKDCHEADIVGLENDVKKIKGWILRTDNKLLKIGIVGMGGLGKTTIAKKIFNDTDVRYHFNQKIWVSVSSSFRVEVILRSILQQSGEESAVVQSEMLHKVVSLLKAKTCLIIFDDIWEKGIDWWKNFFSSDLAGSACSGSCFIITTRNKEVADAIKANETHHPKVLDDKKSWLLFSKHAFPEVKEESLEKFKEVGKKIVSECGGLPLAIKTIGGLLGSKPHSLQEWKKICDNFSVLDITEENSVVMKSLQLSYDALPPHLKQCLLCFSIYPEDFDIQAEKLIHWWIGEGLIHGKDSETTFEMGFKHLSMLVSRCLVEVVDTRGYDGRVYSCKMHDLVRDLTLAMAGKEKVCSFDEEGQKLTSDSRWLGFTSEMDAQSLNKTPKLRALLQTTNNQAQLHSNLGSLCSLRALDLSSNKLDNVALKKLLRWISSLERLAYLNLSGSKGLEEVPDSISKLRNLQILVLSGCRKLSKLSPSITYLKRLIILDLSSCDKLPYLPHGLGSLSQLQQLSGLRLASQSNRKSCQLLELGKLGELRILRMHLSKDSDITSSDVLSKLKKLKVLAIDFDTEKLDGKYMQEMLEQLPPPQGLEELYLRRYHHDTLPKWVIPDSLPHLAYLCIEDGGLFDIRAGEITWNLEGLCLKLLPYLKKDWNILTKEMPLLRYAEVSGCSQIDNFPKADPGIWRA